MISCLSRGIEKEGIQGKNKGGKGGTWTHSTRTRAIDTQDLHQSAADGGEDAEEADKGLTPPVEGFGAGAGVGPCKSSESAVSGCGWFRSMYRSLARLEQREDEVKNPQHTPKKRGRIWLTAGAVADFKLDFPHPAGHGGQLTNDIYHVIEAPAREHLARRVVRREECEQRRHQQQEEGAPEHVPPVAEAHPQPSAERGGRQKLSLGQGSVIVLAMHSAVFPDRSVLVTSGVSLARLETNARRQFLAARTCGMSG